MSAAPRVGQRWVSEAEPELGLGVISQLTERHIQLFFPAAETQRRYATASAPVHRVQLRVGDPAESEDGLRFTVEEVREEEGLNIYCGEGHALLESRLSATLAVRGPEDRLLSGRVDRSSAYSLRLETLEHLQRLRRSPARGFVGARVDLLPHQLYVAQEVASRHLPRALLADEVGLGKTIEAGLILHRLMSSGRASRVLVLVPESLVHQWFVEMLRRFNASFRVVDADFCEAVAERDPDANPFEDAQTAICQLSFLARTPERAAQAMDAGWDVVVVDEAHHLHWEPGAQSPEYQIVEKLSRETSGLLLLTATPEQLGLHEHFARLRLLDPDRYHDYAEFENQADSYHQVAEIASNLIDGAPFTKADASKLRDSLPQRGKRLRDLLGAATRDDDGARDRLLEELLDRHGPGRVIFRNTRAALTGFPERSAELAPIEPGRGTLEAIQAELVADIDPGAPRPGYAFDDDPRLEWLLGLLRDIGEEKVLLICRYREKAEALAEALRKRTRIRLAPFHEGLPMLRRDRNAAWFGEPGDAGARVLIASEIGSEGRNFQFAHHLVLFDLPFEPEVLEQRIGRLDRIGQRSIIRVHVPFMKGTSQETLVRWYHEGLGAFDESLPSGDYFLDNFGGPLLAILRAGAEKANAEIVDELVELVREFRDEVREQLATGRDRLLEMSSFRKEPAETLRQAIRALDDSHALDGYVPRLLEHFGAEVEDLGPRSFLLSQSSGLRVESLPGFRREELAVTCDRRRGLEREDLEFLSWEHPIVSGAMELLSGSEDGNAAIGRWEGAPLDGLLAETVFMVECVAPPELFADRFLPPTPIRVIVDHGLKEASPELRAKLRSARLADASAPLARDEELSGRVRNMLDRCRAIALERMAPLTKAASDTAKAALDRELNRLRALREVNDHIPKRELDLAAQERKRMLATLDGARLRLDSIRLVWMQRAAAPRRP